MLIQIDGRQNCPKLMGSSDECYCPEFGRPAIYLEVMVKLSSAIQRLTLNSYRTLRMLQPSTSEAVQCAQLGL